MKSVITEDGQVKSVFKDGEKVIDIEEVRETLNEANGNPQILAVLEGIVKLLEQLDIE